MGEKRHRPLAALVALLLLATSAAGRNAYGANSSCGQKTFVASEGTISSPGYPLPYPDRVSCTWKIVTAPGAVLNVNINDVDIEGDSDGDGASCGRNWLSVSVDVGGRTEKLCGSRPRPLALTLRQQLTVVKFLASSANVEHRKGFTLSYFVSSCPSPESLPCDERATACFPRRQRCDGNADCPSGRDEQDCPRCGPQEFPCSDGSGCYSRSQLCDQVRHCRDFSDEVGCPGRCGHAEGLAACRGEGCFRPATDLCDGRFDCPGGEDELGCDPLCPEGFNCSSGKRRCYAPSRRCDGVRDCPGGEDEVCFREERFRCDNRLRVPRYLTCNGVDNCGDGSDERNCLKTSVITAAIVGSLLCGLLLVLAVGCTCRLYGLRVANSAALRVYLEQPPRPPELLTREPPPAYHVAVSGCPLQRLPPPPPQGAPPRRSSRRPSSNRRRRPPPATVGIAAAATGGEGGRQPPGGKRTDAAPEDDGESSRCPASPSSSSESPSRDSVTSSSFLSGDDDVPLLV